MALAVVTGATGLLGGNLTLELLRQGHTVRATRRGQSKVAQLEGHPIEWVSADLADVDALTRAFAGAEVVFHCAAQVGTNSRLSPQMRAANVDGTQHVIDAVRAAKVKRLVHCSSTTAVGLSDDGKPCTETARWNFAERGLSDGYGTSKHLAEEVVNAAVKDGLDAVVVCPGYMFGPLDARPSSGTLIVEVMKGKVPGKATGFNNFVDVRDVARGMVLAWKKGTRGERYILGGENLEYGRLMVRIALIAGVRPPRFYFPLALALPVGWFGDLQERVFKKDPLLTSISIRISYCKDFIVSSEKAKRELGYTWGSVDTAIADAMAWFRAQGMV